MGGVGSGVEGEGLGVGGGGVTPIQTFPHRGGRVKRGAAHLALRGGLGLGVCCGGGRFANRPYGRCGCVRMGWAWVGNWFLPSQEQGMGEVVGYGGETLRLRCAALRVTIGWRGKGEEADPHPFDRLRTGLTFSQDGRREGGVKSGRFANRPYGRWKGEGG